MSRDKIIWVKINTKSYYNILVKLNDIGITIYDNKFKKDYILIETKYEDYKRIKKYLVSYKISIYESTGIDKFKEIFNKYIVFSCGIIISIIILFIANMTVFKIDIKTSNKKIHDIVERELNKNGLKRLTLKKEHFKIEKIVSKILDENKDTLEWLEIKYDGLVMIVNVTEKTQTKKEEEYPNCNIIARTDAKISSLNIYRGIPLKEINDYVTKGEVILSGSITHNEEVKNNVCADGEVYGEVWYKVKIELPFKETITKYTGKNRYNLNIKIDDDKYTILKSRLKQKKEEEINLYKLNDFEINLVKEKEYVKEENILSKDEAYNKAIKLATEKINLKLRENEKILVKKVLKKELNDSTIYLEVFIVTKENIGVRQVVKEEALNDNKYISESNE